MDIQEPLELHDNLQLSQIQLATAPISLEFTEKAYELSEFAFDFYKREQNMDRKNDSSQQLEKLLLTNLHTSFNKLKSDFCAPLRMLNEYLKISADSKFIVSPEACHFVNRLSHGNNCPTLEQEILGLKLLARILQNQTPQ